MENVIRPSLQGKHIVITRLEEAGCSLTQQLQSAGARVSPLPLVEIHPLAFTWPKLSAYDWVFFTSQQAVHAFAAAYRKHLPPSGNLPQMGVVGAATAACLKTYGFSVDFIPPVFEAQEAADAFCALYPAGGLQVLWPCGTLARPQFAEILSRGGMQVTPLQVYETRQVLPQADHPVLQALQQEPVDLVIFTSPSAVKVFAQLPLSFPDIAFASMGPSTSEAIASYLQKRPAVEAFPHTMQGLWEGIQRFFEYPPSVIGKGANPHGLF